ATATPEEFFNYFREQRTALRAALLTVPVSRFLPLVKDKPPESELRTRYEKYKDQEPSPTSREPGFNEPRRIRVEHLYASPEDPYSRELTKQRLAAWAAASALAGSPLRTLVNLAADPLRQEYENELRLNDFPWFYNPREDLTASRERLTKLHYT